MQRAVIQSHLGTVNKLPTTESATASQPSYQVTLKQIVVLNESNE